MTALTDSDRDDRDAAESTLAESRADARRDDAPWQTIGRDPREIAYRELLASRAARDRAGVDERPSSTFNYAAGNVAGVCTRLLASGYDDLARPWAAAATLLWDRSLRRSGVRGGGAL